MGYLWEAYQQISNREIDEAQSDVQLSLAERLASLEDVVRQQNQVLGALIQQLDLLVGEDLDGDQRIG